MALPFISDLHLQGVSQSKDWSFLNQNIQQANKQYEQGLAQVESDYSAVLSAPVTNIENAQKKAEYVKQFNDGLNKLAGSRLDLPKNQAEAQKIIAPFWQDAAMLTDMSYTKFKTAEIQKGQSAQYSKDDDIRNSYSPESVELMQRQLNNLRTMSRDEVNKSNLDWDTYTPADNISNILGKHKKDDGFEVVQDIQELDSNGRPTGYIRKITNGPSSISNYKVYADGILGKQYNNHYNVLGKLSIERQVDTYRQMGISRPEALKMIAEQEYPRVMGTYENHLMSIGKTIEQKQEQLRSLNQKIVSQGGVPDSTQQSALTQLQAELGNYKAMQNQVGNSYKELLTENGKRGFMLQPVAGISNRYRQEDIDKWAYAMSQDVGVEIKEDSPFWKGQQLKKEYAQLGETARHNKVEEGLAQQRVGIDATRAQLEGMKLQAEHPELFQQNAQIAPGGRYSGQATNQVWTQDPALAADAKKNEVHDQVYGTVYNPAGISSILYKAPGLSANDVNGFTEFMNKYYTGGVELNKKPDGTWSAKGANNEMINSYWKVANYLHDQTGIEISDVGKAHSALLAHTARYVQDHTRNGSADSEEVAKLRSLYTNVKTGLDALDKDDAQRKANLVNYVNTGEGAMYKRYTRPTPGGGIRIINSEDIKNELPNITVRPVGAFSVGKNMNLSAKDLASSYITWQLNVADIGLNTSEGHFPKMKIGDKEYIVTSVNGKNAVNSSEFTDIISNVYRKYGTPEQVKAGINTLNNKVIPGTEFYNRANNIIGNRFTYDIDPDKNKVNRDRLEELVQPGNYTTMYTVQTGNKTPEVSPEAQSAIQNMLNNSDYKQYIGTSFNYYPSGFNGKAMAEIKIADELPKNAPDAYKSLQGKTILVEKAPNASGTYIQQFPKMADYSFHPLNTGKTISSDPIDNQVGRGSYSISPWPQYNPSQYTITMTKEVVNSKTGQVESITNTVTADAKTTDPEKLTSDIRGILYANGANYYQQLNTLRANLNSGRK